MSTKVPARVAADSEQADQDLAALAAELAKAQDTPPAEPAEPAEPSSQAPAPSVQPVNEDLLRQMDARLASLTGRTERLAIENQRLQAELEARAKQPDPAHAPAPAPTTRHVTDTDLEEFGEDTISMVRRVAADEVAELRRQVSDLSTRLAGMDGRVKRVADVTEATVVRNQQTAEQSYYENLGKAIPDWQAVNSDPKFEQWLAVPDQFSGRVKHDLLIEAHKALDAGRVIAIFTAYKQSSGNQAPTASAASPNSQPAVDPASQVAPSTTSAAPAPSSNNQGRIFSSKEYDDMHADMLRKRISKTEFDAFEKEYFLAVAEGRVAV